MDAQRRFSAVDLPDDLPQVMIMLERSLELNSKHCPECPAEASVMSFTCWLSVEATQADCKGLQSRKWIAVIHGKYVFSNLSEL